MDGGRTDMAFGERFVGFALESQMSNDQPITDWAT